MHFFFIKLQLPQIRPTLSEFKSFCKTPDFDERLCNLVSSANIIHVLDTQSGKSLILIMKRIGLSILLRGTPLVTSVVLE